MNIVNATTVSTVTRDLSSLPRDHPAVIGYQVDNETKYYYDSVSDDIRV